MASIFEGVTIHQFNDDLLSFNTETKPMTLELIDESDKLLIRSKTTHGDKFSIEIFKETPCAEFGKNGFVITDENGKSVLLRFTRHHAYEQEKGNYRETDFHRFAKLVTDFKLGRRESIFSLRTDDSSATQYFQFYGYLSQQQNMMQDFIRTSTYQRAILLNELDFKDKVVLDVGAGSGILSFFAVQAGARKVYAVEASSMAKHAQTLVASNKLADKMIVIPGKIEEITLPEQVDVIISEPMGYMLFNERMLETFLHAKKWLVPNGKMFPTQGDLHVAPFSDSQLFNEQLNKSYFWLQNNFHGVDLTALQEAALKEYFYQPVVDTFDIRICMAKSQRYSVNFLKAHENDLHRMEIALKFSMLESSDIHGLAFWFDVAFFGSQHTLWLSTAPTQPLTHWYQVRCLIDKPLFVKRGQTLAGKVVLVSNKRQSYNVEIELQVEEEPCLRAANSLDLKNPYFRYSGQPTNPPPGWNCSSPSEEIWLQVESGNRYVYPGVDQPITQNGLVQPVNAGQPATAGLNASLSNGAVINGVPPGSILTCDAQGAPTMLATAAPALNSYPYLNGTSDANNGDVNMFQFVQQVTTPATMVAQPALSNGNGPSITNGLINGGAVNVAPDSTITPASDSLLTMIDGNGGACWHTIE